MFVLVTEIDNAWQRYALHSRHILIAQTCFLTIFCRITQDDRKGLSFERAITASRASASRDASRWRGVSNDRAALIVSLRPACSSWSHNSAIGSAPTRTLLPLSAWAACVSAVASGRFVASTI